MYHPQSGYSESVLASLGLASNEGGDDANDYQPVDLFSQTTTSPSDSRAVFVLPSNSDQQQQQQSSSAHGAVGPYAPPGGVTAAAAGGLSTPFPDRSGRRARPLLASPSRTAIGGVAHPPVSADPMNACAFILLVLGEPGSGKSSVCARLERDLAFVHLDCNALIAAEIKAGSNTGRLIADVLRLGRSVPGEIIADLLKAQISRRLGEGRAFFAVEHFPSDVSASKAWQKHMAAGMERVVHGAAGAASSSHLKVGGGLASAIEMRATNRSACTERMLRRALPGDEAAAIEQRQQHYDAVVQPLLADISRFSLAILARIPALQSTEAVWAEVQRVVAAMVVRTSLSPPLPSAHAAGAAQPGYALHTDAPGSLLLPEPGRPAVGRRARQRLFPLFLFGGPGSGRTTLARKLAQELGFVHLSYDEIILRASVEQQSGAVAPVPLGAGAVPTGHETERALLLSSLLRDNRAVPADMACQLVMQALRSSIAAAGGQRCFVFDGFPAQAEHWSALLRELYGVDPEADPSLAAQLSNHVTGFYLDVSERIRHSRLSRRRGPRDSPRSIESRMRLYEVQTLGLEAALMASCPRTIHRVHAGLSEAEVAKEVLRRLAADVVPWIDITGVGALGTLGGGPELALLRRDQTSEEAVGVSSPRHARPAASASSGGEEDVVYTVGGTHTLASHVGASLSSPAATASFVSDVRRPLARLLFLFGPPGSGQRSLAIALSEEYSLVHLDLSALADAAVANRGVHRAAILAHQQRTGADDPEQALEPLPSHIALELLSSSLSSYMKAGVAYFVLTGFPLSLHQLAAFQTHLAPQVHVVKSMLLEVAPPTAPPTAATGQHASTVTERIHASLSGLGASMAATAAASTAAARDTEAQRVCMDRLSSRGDRFEDSNAKLRMFFHHTKPMIDSFTSRSGAAPASQASPRATGGSLSAAGSGAVGGAPQFASSVGSFCGAPVYALHAGSKVSALGVLEQARALMADLSFLRLPSSSSSLSKRRAAPTRALVFVLLLMGGPGAGRAEVARRVLQDFSFVHVDIDALLNAEIESGSAEGLVLQQVFLHGGPLPADSVALCVRRFISRQVSDGRSHFLVSGFPLDAQGWAAFRDAMGSAGAESFPVCFLDCPEEIRMERLQARGDPAEVIEQSCAFFREKTRPLIDEIAYGGNSNGTVITVSAMEAREVVYANVKAELEGLLRSLRAPPSATHTHGTMASSSHLARTLLPSPSPSPSHAHSRSHGDSQASPPGPAKTELTSTGRLHDTAASRVAPGDGVLKRTYASMRYNILFLFSSPGAGSSTLLRRLKMELSTRSPTSSNSAAWSNLHVLSLRELVPGALASGSALGRTIDAHLRAQRQSRLNRGEKHTSPLSPSGFGADDLFPLVPSHLLAQLLKQRLEELLLAQEDADHKQRINGAATGSASASASSPLPLSKINVLVEGFPCDERGWEEFLSLIQPSQVDTRSIWLDAPEHLRRERLSNKGRWSASEIEQRCAAFRTRLYPLLQRLRSTTVVGLDGAAEAHPSLTVISTVPSADVVYLQLLQALVAKFGLWGPSPMHHSSHDADAHVWRHPYGLKRRVEGELAATPTAATVGAMQPSLSLPAFQPKAAIQATGSIGSSTGSSVASAKVVFVLGAGGSGCSSFCTHLSSQAFQLQSGGTSGLPVRFHHIDVDELYRAHARDNPGLLSTDAPGSEAHAGRNVRLTMDLLRKALQSHAPKEQASSVLLNANSSDSDDDEEDNAIAELMSEPPVAPVGPADHSTTLFVVSSFPQNMSEWGAWQQHEAEARTSSDAPFAQLVLAIHFNTDLLTSSKRLLARGDDDSLVKQRLQLWQHHTVPVAEALARQASQSGTFAFLRIHAAPPLAQVLVDALTQMRKRHELVAAVEHEQSRLAGSGDARAAHAMKRRARGAAATARSQGMVGSHSTMYTLGDKSGASSLLEVRSLLDQFPRISEGAGADSAAASSVVVNLVFVAGPPGSGVTTQTARLARTFQRVASVHMEALLSAEVASGSRRGALIASRRAEHKPVSKLLRITLLLQHLLSLCRAHLAAAKAAAAAAQSFLPGDDGQAVAVEAPLALDPLAIFVAGFPSNRTEWHAWYRVLESSFGASGAPLRHLGVLVLDVDSDTSIQRLLRAGFSALHVEQRMGAWKRAETFVRTEFQADPVRFRSVTATSELPDWKEQAGIGGETPAAFGVDARSPEEDVAAALDNFVSQYVHRTRIALPRPGATAASIGSSNGASPPRPLSPPVSPGAQGQVFTVGRALDPRPNMQWLVMCGAPGAGVRTYAQRIRAAYDFEVVDLGALVCAELRRRGADATPDSKAVAQHHQQRALLPADLAVRLLMKAVLHANSLGKAQFLILGFPQTDVQWALLQSAPEMVAQGSHGQARLRVAKILFLDCPEVQRVARMEEQLASGVLSGPDAMPSSNGGAWTSADSDARIRNYNAHTKKIMSDLLAQGLLTRISTKTPNGANGGGTDESAVGQAPSVDDQVAVVFARMCGQHIDPTWRFLRHGAGSVHGFYSAADEQQHARMVAAATPDPTTMQLQLKVPPSPRSDGGGSLASPQGPSRLQPQPPSGPRTPRGASTPLSRSTLHAHSLSSLHSPGRLSRKHTLFVLFLMGGAGSGRRSMSRRLERQHESYIDVDMEALEQAEMDRQTEAGKSMLASRSQGRPPPPSLSLLLLGRAMKHAAVLDKRLAIVHGFPADVESLRAWQDVHGQQNLAMIYLDCDETMRNERLAQEGVTPQQCQSLHSSFAAHTLPLLELVERESDGAAVKRVDATAPTERVFERVQEACAEFLTQVAHEVHTSPAPVAQQRAQPETAKVEPERAVVATTAPVAASKPSPPPMSALAAKAARSQLEGEYLHVRCSASDLEQPSFFSSANPYLEFYRFVPYAAHSSSAPASASGLRAVEEEEKQGSEPGLSRPGRWEKIYQSKVCMNTLQPGWDAFLLDADSLCARDERAPVLVALWSWARNEQAKFMGAAQTSVGEMRRVAAATPAPDASTAPFIALSRAIQLNSAGELSDASASSAFLSPRGHAAGKLSFSVCTRLIYRPTAEILAATPRPPSAAANRGARDELHVPPPQLAPALSPGRTQLVPVPVVGSASTSGSVGSSADGFSAVSASTLLAAAERVYEQSECVVRLCMAGEELQSKGWSVGASSPTASQSPSGPSPPPSARPSCDPFVELYGLRHSPSTRRPVWHLSYTSEVAEGTRSPKWNVLLLALWPLCANDYYRPLLLRVWDRAQATGAHEFIGEVQTHLAEILSKANTQARFQLVHPTRARGHGDSVGSLLFSYARVFSDIKYSQIERPTTGIPHDIATFQNPAAPTATQQPPILP